MGRFDQRRRRRRIRLAPHERDNLLTGSLKRANFLQDPVDGGRLRSRYPIGFRQCLSVEDTVVSKIIRESP